MPFTTRTSPPRSHRSAFTLAEVIVSIALMGITLTSALTAVAYAARDRRYTAQMQLGTSLASSLLSEALAQRTSDPTGAAPPATGSPRTTFNDIFDFANYTDSPPTTRDAALIPNATGWSRTVTVQRALVDPVTFTPTITAASTAPLVLVTVTVRSPVGKTYTAAAYRSTTSLADQSTPLAGTTTGLSVKLSSDQHTDWIALDLWNQPEP